MNQFTAPAHKVAEVDATAWNPAWDVLPYETAVHVVDTFRFEVKKGQFWAEHEWIVFADVRPMCG